MRARTKPAEQRHARRTAAQRPVEKLAQRHERIGHAVGAVCVAVQRRHVCLAGMAAPKRGLIANLSNEKTRRSGFFLEAMNDQQ
jgi:hypothetical protein